MIKQSNIAYIAGTTAQNLAYENDETLIVSYDAALARRVEMKRCEAGSHSARAREIARNLRGPECTITKAEYLFGMAFCFAGSVLVYALGLFI